jgi:hypothetical protein
MRSVLHVQFLSFVGAGTAQSVQQLDYGLENREINSILHSIWTSSEIHPASYPLDTTGSFSRAKAAMVRTDHSPLSNAETRNAWSYSLLSLISMA